jgi:Transcriptional regulators
MTDKDSPTIQDVANFANVSTATVSRVLTGKDKVKDETKIKVLAAVEQLGYDSRKKNLLSNHDSKTILVCVTELKNPFIVPIIDGIQNSARKHDYNVLILQTKDFYTEFSEYETVLREQKFAGVIFLSSLTNKQLAGITNQLNYRCPIVFCSEYIEDSDISFVAIDDFAAIQKSSRYLLSVGRKNILFINSKLSHNYARKRELGFRTVMEEANIPINENYIVHLSSVTYTLAYSTVLHILSQKEKPDAILCVSDVYAIAALKACQKLGIRVPDDCAIIGFDNIDLTTMLQPSLTTIEQPCYQMGYQSSELLIESIQFPNKQQKQIILETELIVRESTPINLKREGE